MQQISTKSKRQSYAGLRERAAGDRDPALGVYHLVGAAASARTSHAFRRSFRVIPAVEMHVVRSLGLSTACLNWFEILLL